MMQAAPAVGRPPPRPEVAVSRFGVYLALALGLLLRAVPSEAACFGIGTDLTWPGPTPCDTTLQACIDSEPCNGGVVEIAKDSNDPIAEAISFQKGLTLRPALGFHPVLNATLSAGTPTDALVRKGAAYRIHIEGLTFAGSGIELFQNSPSPLSAEVVGNAIQGSSQTGVLVEGTGSGRVSFDVSGNTLTFPQFGIDIVTLGADGTIANNTISVDSGAAIVFGSRNVSSVDVIANTIHGTSEVGGIIVGGQAGDVIQARILDNLAWSESITAGLAAITLRDNGSTLSADVVNNTVVGNTTGILVAGGMTGGLLANNIVSGNFTGVRIDPDSAATFQNRDNLVFGNLQDFFVADPSTIAQDPLFVGNGDYHLQAGSPAIDAGDDGAVPSDLLTDLDGSPRIRGDRVDLGAYEAPEPASALGGAAALLALALRSAAVRRRA